MDFSFFRKLGTVYPYLCYGTVAKGTSAKDRHNNGNIVLSNIYYEFCDKDSRYKNLKAILEWAKDYSYCAESGLKFQVRPSTVRPRPLHGMNLSIGYLSAKKHLLEGKDAYAKTKKFKHLIPNHGVRRLKRLLSDGIGNESAIRSFVHSLTKLGRRLPKVRSSGKFLIWILHQEANAQGPRFRPISNNIGYPTGQVSHFLQSKLIPTW